MARRSRGRPAPVKAEIATDPGCRRRNSSSAACPGSLGFVARELLVDAAVGRMPYLGLATVVATALSAVGVMKMFLALFCGRKPGPVSVRLRRRELTASVVLVAIVFGPGLWPGPIVARQVRAAQRLMLVEAAAPATWSPAMARPRPGD